MQGATAESDRRRRRPRSWLWLGLMVVAFFAASTYAGVANYASDLPAGNAVDVGILTQAVGSTASGHYAPFYESYDCMVKDRCSYLLVHPSLVLYLATPIYALAPSSLTLFVLRASLVALAGVPLFLLTRSVTRSAPKGLMAVGLFFVWAPSVLGDAFSLHPEALLPLEFFTLAWLWQTGRYRWGLLVALVAFLTMEFTPIFAFLLGLFFLAPRLEGLLWPQRGRIEAPPVAPVSLAPPSRWSRLRELTAETSVRYSLALMLLSLVAYALLLTFMNVWGARVLGVSSPPVPPGLGGVFYNNSTPAIQGLGTILASPQTLDTAEFWLLLYALVGFLPLFAPRTSILSVPWIAWTFATDSFRFTTIGHQYTMIAAVPLFIGVAYGLRRVPLGEPTPSRAGAARPAAAGVHEEGPVPPPRSTWDRRKVRKAWVGGLVILVVANGLLLPLDPILPAMGFHPGAPFVNAYYFENYTPAPGAQALESLLALVPAGATVGLGPTLLPLMINNPHAFLVLPLSRYLNVSHLPFPASARPAYVALAASPLPSARLDNFTRNLTDPSIYGLRGYVGVTGSGPMVLYQLGFTGVATVLGPPLSATDGRYTPTSGLHPGPFGLILPGTSSAPEEIGSVPNASRLGEVWTGPGAFVTPGTYSVTLELRASYPSGFAPSDPVVRVIVRGFGPELVNQSVLASELPSGVWENVSFRISSSDPIPNLDVQGLLRSFAAQVSVASLTIRPS